MIKCDSAYSLQLKKMINYKIIKKMFLLITTVH